MLIYTLIIIVVSQTYSLHRGYTDYSHNRLVRHMTEYKVNISMVDEDIEMAGKEHVRISNTTSKLSKTYKKLHKTLHDRLLDAQKRNSTDVSKLHLNNSFIRSSISAAKSEDKSKRTHHIVAIDGNKTKSEGETNLPRIARAISADRMWSIVQIWLIIYFILAIPLWCTIGRCCCCLVCKCFKAQETIREAKMYAMWNPPGVLRRSSGDVTYTPSEKEKEAYEELEHLIRTL